MTNPKLERAKRQSPESFTTPKFTFPTGMYEPPTEAGVAHPETHASRDVPVPCVPPDPVIPAAAEPRKAVSPTVDVFDPGLREELEARPLRLSSVRWMQRIDGWKCPACESPLHVHAGERFERTALRIPRHAVAAAERRRCPLFGLVSWETMPSESNAFTERVHEATGRYAVEFAHLILRNARRIQIRACGASTIRNRMEENERRVHALTTNSTRSSKIDAWAEGENGNPSTWSRFEEFPRSKVLRVHAGPAPLRENLSARGERARRTLARLWGSLRVFCGQPQIMPGVGAFTLCVVYRDPKRPLDALYSHTNHMTAHEAIEALLYQQPDLGMRMSVEDFAFKLARAFGTYRCSFVDDAHEERHALVVDFAQGTRLILEGTVIEDGVRHETRS